jgi:hypothetical protein
MMMRVRYSTLILFVAMILAPRVMAQDQWPTKRWPTSTPAAVGLDPKALAELDADLAGGKYGYLDSMLIIRHGKAVYDRSYKHDYDRIYGEQAKKPGPPRLAWAGSGFGGQIPMVVSDYDLVIVFTGWNIHDDRNKRLSHRVAIDRVIRAMVKPHPNSVRSSSRGTAKQ